VRTGGVPSASDWTHSALSCRTLRSCIPFARAWMTVAEADAAINSPKV
jgi:hypothetical protein